MDERLAREVDEVSSTSLRAGWLIDNMTFRPFLVFETVAEIDLAVCYPLSFTSRLIERRLHVGRAGLAHR